MVKYSDNPDYEYEQIDLATMYELRDARLVKAQIVAIDRVNNCAEVILADSCAELSGKDLSAVPFFYHCDNSIGTVEDLERGHLAFSDNDYVYCIWAPATGDLNERFYIIGHDDLRGIGWCKNEILYLKTAEQTGPDSGYVYCLFDATAGRLLDLELFTNIDDASPAKPLSAIGLGSTDIDDWVDYNFSDVTPTVTVPYYSSYETYPDIGATSATENITGETAFTGFNGNSYSSTPQDCSVLEDPGNGLYMVTANRPITEAKGLIEGTETVYIKRSNPFVAQITANDCQAAWGHTESTIITTYRSTVDFRTRLTLTDTGTLDEISFGCSFIDSIQKETYSDLSTSGDLLAEVHVNHSVIIDTHFEGFEQLNKSYEFTRSATTTYSNDGTFPPYSGTEDLTRDSGVGSFLTGRYSYIGEGFVYPDVMGPARPIFIGEFAAYCITGASIYIEEYDNTDPDISSARVNAVDFGLIGIPSAPTIMCNHGVDDFQAKAHFVPDPPGDDILVFHRRSVKVFIAPFAFVSPFYGDFGADGSETIQTCFANTDPELSVALGDALQSTFDAFLAHVNTLGFDEDEYSDFYTYTLKHGIAETRIIKRKTV